MECHFWSGEKKNDQAWWSPGWYLACIVGCSWERVVTMLFLTKWGNHSWELSRWRFSWPSRLEDQQCNLGTTGNLAQRCHSYGNSLELALLPPCCAFLPEYDNPVTSTCFLSLLTTHNTINCFTLSRTALRNWSSLRS